MVAMPNPKFPEKPILGAYDFVFKPNPTPNKFPKKPRGGAYDLTDTNENVEFSEAEDLGNLLSWMEEEDEEKEDYSQEPSFSLDFEWDIEPF